MEPEAHQGGATNTGEGVQGQQAEPSTGERRAAIVAAVRAKQGGSEPGGAHNPAQAGSTPASATTPDPAKGEKTGGDQKPAAHDPRDAEIADLRAKFAALESKLSAPPAPKPDDAAKSDRYAELKARVAKNPSILLDEFPEIGGIEKLSDDWLRRQEDPGYERATAVSEELKELRAKLEAKEQAEKDAKAASDAAAAEKAGRDGIKAIVDSDKARWPRITRDAKNVDEAINEAIASARKVAAGLKRDVPEEEARKIVADCLDEVEKEFAARAGRYSLPDISAAPKPRAGIASATGSVGAVRDPEDTGRKLSKAEIIERVRRGSAARPTP